MKIRKVLAVSLVGVLSACSVNSSSHSGPSTFIWSHSEAHTSQAPVKTTGTGQTVNLAAGKEYLLTGSVNNDGGLKQVTYKIVETVRCVQDGSTVPDSDPSDPQTTLVSEVVTGPAQLSGKSLNALPFVRVVKLAGLSDEAAKSQCKPAPGVLDNHVMVNTHPYDIYYSITADVIRADGTPENGFIAFDTAG